MAAPVEPSGPSWPATRSWPTASDGRPRREPPVLLQADSAAIPWQSGSSAEDGRQATIGSRGENRVRTPGRSVATTSSWSAMASFTGPTTSPQQWLFGRRLRPEGRQGTLEGETQGPRPDRSLEVLQPGLDGADRQRRLRRLRPGVGRPVRRAGGLQDGAGLSATSCSRESDMTDEVIAQVERLTSREARALRRVRRTVARRGRRRGVGRVPRPAVRRRGGCLLGPGVRRRGRRRSCFVGDPRRR